MFSFFFLFRDVRFYRFGRTAKSPSTLGKADCITIILPRTPKSVSEPLVRVSNFLTFQSAICISSCRLTPSAWAPRVLTPSLSSATASARNWERWKFNSCIRLGLSGSPGETVVGRGEE